MISDDVHSILERETRLICDEQRVILHAIGFMPDHVHVVASIPPSVTVSTLVGRIKGAASHRLSHSVGGTGVPGFAWQSEYGVLSFGEKALAEVVAYVQNQRQHHASQSLWPTLERISDSK